MGIAVWAGLAATSAQAGTVTVGSPFTASPAGSFGGTATEVNVALGEPGARIASPVSGTIVSYRVGVAVLGRFAIRVIRPAAGGAATGAGSSAPATPSSIGIQSFSANLPIRVGDLIGLDLLDPSSAVDQLDVNGSTINEWGNNGFLADGETAPPKFVYGDMELGFNAEVAPSNSIDVGPTQRNKKKGSATLNVTLPNPGTLTASGNGAQVSSTGSSGVSRQVAGGPVQLLIKAKGKRRKTLRATGKVKLNVALTYTPTLGDPHTESLKVKLKKL